MICETCRYSGWRSIGSASFQRQSRSSGCRGSAPRPSANLAPEAEAPDGRRNGRKCSLPSRGLSRLGKQPVQGLDRSSSEETTGLCGGTGGEQNGTCCQQRALHDCLQKDALGVAQSVGRPTVKRIGEGG